MKKGAGIFRLHLFIRVATRTGPSSSGTARGLEVTRFAFAIRMANYSYE